MKKNTIVVVLLLVIFMSLYFASFDRFRLDFSDCSLVYVPSSQTLQISTVGNVLSYGQGWTVQQVKSYLYHFRLNTWSGFYWMVNTSRREVYRVTGGTFGSVGGNQTKLNINVDVTGSGNSPTRFSLRFTDAYLIYSQASRDIQIAAAGTVLSYGHDWQKAEVKPYLIHIKQNNWSGFYWQVNTSRKEFYNYQGGTFGSISPGSQTLLNIPVTVYGQQTTQTYNLNLSAMMGGSVNGSGQYSAGTMVNIQAIPNAGYQFLYWKQGSSIISHQANYTYQMPAQNLTLVANFEQQAVPGQPRLGVYVEDHPLGVIVTNIMSGYPASGKIQNGDVLTHIGFLNDGAVTSLGGGMVRIGMNTINVNFPQGTQIQNTPQLQSFIANIPMGHAAVIWILRGGVHRLFVWLNPGTAFSSSYIF